MIALISSGDARSFQMTMPRTFITLPTHDARRAASSIFWIFVALHRTERQEEADGPPAADGLFDVHGEVPFKTALA